MSRLGMELSEYRLWLGQEEETSKLSRSFPGIFQRPGLDTGVWGLREPWAGALRLRPAPHHLSCPLLVSSQALHPGRRPGSNLSTLSRYTKTLHEKVRVKFFIFGFLIPGPRSFLPSSKIQLPWEERHPGSVTLIPETLTFG